MIARQIHVEPKIKISKENVGYSRQALAHIGVSCFASKALSNLVKSLYFCLPIISNLLKITNQLS